jgi:hypothetical protein
MSWKFAFPLLGRRGGLLIIVGRMPAPASQQPLRDVALAKQPGPEQFPAAFNTPHPDIVLVPHGVPVVQVAVDQ